jgi:hypothetical protein
MLGQCSRNRRKGGAVEAADAAWGAPDWALRFGGVWGVRAGKWMRLTHKSGKGQREGLQWQLRRGLAWFTVLVGRGVVCR